MNAAPLSHANSAVSRGFDPVRARVHFEPLTTNAERLQALEAARAAAERSNDRRNDRRKNRAPLGFDALRDTRVGRYVQNLHPGDIVYWVAGLAGACLLLIKATI